MNNLSEPAQTGEPCRAFLMNFRFEARDCERLTMRLEIQPARQIKERWRRPVVTSAQPPAGGSGLGMDGLTPDRRSANMRAIRSKNTKPELIVRSLAFRAGYRFRLHDRNLPGSPDLVFSARRKVIFVHGCFWHSHEGCPKAYKPKSREAFWFEKFQKNRARDALALSAIRASGWDPLVVWECEAVDADLLRQRLSDFLGPPRITPARP